MSQGEARKPVKTIPIKKYLRRFFTNTLIVILHVVLFGLVLTSFLTFRTIEKRTLEKVEALVSHVFDIIEVKLMQLSKAYSESIISTVHKSEEILLQTGELRGLELREKLGKFLRRELDEKYRGLFDELNFYLMDENGLIYETDFEPDLGLDLSTNREFWTNLLRVLRTKGIFYHVGTEQYTGLRRVYAYKLLWNGHILELGFRISPELYSKDVEGLETVFPFVERLTVLTLQEKPVWGLPEPLPPIRKFSFESLYKRERKIEKNLSHGEVPETFFILVRLNLRPIFQIFEFSVLGSFVYLISISVFSRILSKKLSAEVEKLKVVINDFSSSRNVERGAASSVQEIQEMIETFSDVAEHLSATVQQLTATNEELESAYESIQKLASEVRDAFYDFSLRLAEIVEGFEEGTGKHLHRVRYVTQKLCEKLISDEEYRDEIVYYSVLHDIGKIFVPQEILNKPGPLSPEEWEEVKRHTVYAKRVLSHPRFNVALNIAMYHHENFDGTGYPYGLVGGEIPIEARIVKIADVFDALVSERPYKRAYSKEEALRIIFEGDGRVQPQHFDPMVLRAFREIVDEL